MLGANSFARNTTGPTENSLAPKRAAQLPVDRAPRAFALARPGNESIQPNALARFVRNVCGSNDTKGRFCKLPLYSRIIFGWLVCPSESGATRPNMIGE